MSSPWKLSLPDATLSTDFLSASLNIAQPRSGLRNVRPFFEANAREFLFQLLISDTHVAEPEVSDAYTRLDDLIVTYAESEQSPVSPQVYWRVLRPDVAECVIGGVELIVSAQTTVLDTHPEISTRSQIPVGEFHLLQDLVQVRYLEVASQPDAKAIDSHDGLGCFVVRPEAGRYSYVEMVHPNDFKRSHVRWNESEGAVELRHQVIDRWMEKGVIVRARLRGIFVEREKDLQTARDLYQEFSAAKIPLTV